MCAQSVITQGTDGQVALPVDSLILVTAKGKTVMLPDAHRHAGLPCTVKNTSSGSQTTVVAPTGQSIDGKSTYKLAAALAVVCCVSDGAGWWVVGTA